VINKHFYILPFHQQKQKIKNHKWRTLRQYKSYLSDKNKIRKTIRFSESEWEQIKVKLDEHNLTFAEFARSAILNKKVKTKLTKDYIYQLQKIGNNLNQIAKNLNSKKSDIPNSEILKTLLEIKNGIEISTK